jgi:hypothetical protein
MIMQIEPADGSVATEVKEPVQTTVEQPAACGGQEVGGAAGRRRAAAGPGRGW